MMTTTDVVSKPDDTAEPKPLHLVDDDDEEETIAFEAIAEVIESWRARKSRERDRDRVFQKVWQYLEGVRNRGETSVAWLTDWEAEHLAAATAELKAWVAGTRKMFERRQKLLGRIEELYDELDANHDEERQRAGMLDLLIKLAKQPADDEQLAAE